MVSSRIFILNHAFDGLMGVAMVAKAERVNMRQGFESRVDQWTHDLVGDAIARNRNPRRTLAIRVESIHCLWIAVAQDTPRSGYRIPLNLNLRRYGVQLPMECYRNDRGNQ